MPVNVAAVGRGARTTVLLGALCTLVLLTAVGCGGGGDSGNAPQASETIDQFAQRFKQASDAAVAGRCDVVRDFNRKAAITIFCGKQAKGLYDHFRVTGAESFGSGGIVDYTDAEAPKGATAVAALDDKGVYRLVSSLILSRPVPGGPRFSARQAGTEPDDEAARDKIANRFIDAIRSKDCDTYFKLGLTPTQNKKTECRIEFDPKTKVQPQIAADPDAEPDPLGGTEAFGFYGLSSDPGHYRTIVLVPGPPGGDPKYLALTFRAQ
jgi:hypothetical protein